MVGSFLGEIVEAMIYIVISTGVRRKEAGGWAPQDSTIAVWGLYRRLVRRPGA